MNFAIIAFGDIDRRVATLADMFWSCTTIDPVIITIAGREPNMEYLPVLSDCRVVAMPDDVPLYAQDMNDNPAAVRAKNLLTADWLKFNAWRALSTEVCVMDLDAFVIHPNPLAVLEITAHKHADLVFGGSNGFFVAGWNECGVPVTEASTGVMCIRTSQASEALIRAWHDLIGMQAGTGGTYGQQVAGLMATHGVHCRHTTVSWGNGLQWFPGRNHNPHAIAWHSGMGAKDQVLARLRVDLLNEPSLQRFRHLVPSLHDLMDVTTQ